MILTNYHIGHFILLKRKDVIIRKLKTDFFFLIVVDQLIFQHSLVVKKKSFFCNITTNYQKIQKHILCKF